jgi:hypothetical protein
MRYTVPPHEEAAVDTSTELLPPNGMTSMPQTKHVPPRGPTPSKLEEHLHSVQDQLREMSKCIRAIQTRTEEWHMETVTLRFTFNEWQLAARVLDRVFFCLYFVGIVISLVTLFPRSDRV